MIKDLSGFGSLVPFSSFREMDLKFWSQQEQGVRTYKSLLGSLHCGYRGKTFLAQSSALLGNACSAASIQAGYSSVFLVLFLFFFLTVLSAYLWLQCSRPRHLTTLGILKLFRRNKCMEVICFLKGMLSFPKLSYNNDKLENHIMFRFSSI